MCLYVKIKFNIKLERLYMQKRFLFIIVTVLFFQACSFNNQTIRSIAQTNSASQIENYINIILDDLVLYKQKLDLRNPNSYNKSISRELINQIKTKQDYINLVQDDKKLNKYNQYLHYAFSSKQIQNRNDFLILGIYKLMYKAFMLNEEHQFAAMEYDRFNMLKLYESLQVIRWKIRTSKDEKGEYLFKTWQNNWQLELANKDLKNLNIIKDLEFIKNGKETIFDHSNFSFEVLISLMLSNTEHILKNINIEPYEMGFSALKSFVFIL